MTRAEFNEIGLSVEDYKAAYGVDPVFDDEVSTIEVPEIAEVTADATAEQPKAKKTKKAKKAKKAEVAATADAQTAEATVDAIVPAEAKAEVVATGEAMSFKNIKAAAEYMAEKFGLKVSNTLDGLYKTKRRGTNKTHGYAVTYNDDKTVVLTPIA